MLRATNPDTLKGLGLLPEAAEQAAPAPDVAELVKAQAEQVARVLDLVQAGRADEAKALADALRANTEALEAIKKAEPRRVEIHMPAVKAWTVEVIESDERTGAIRKLRVLAERSTNS